MAVHTIWDYITRPVARTIDDVPWCAEAITPDWLTAVLCAGVADARVLSVEICGGDQGSSVRRRLKVAYNDPGGDAGLPENLFCKTTPTVLTRLATGLSAAGEARFYRQIRPELNIEARMLSLRVGPHVRPFGTPVQRFDCNQRCSVL
ncbi:MAG: hypothetical protein JWM69_64 [Candidatus Binatus sp.]|nr:hypothetical protein [Candidatus Binatus sp.]